ncbi:LysR family transcriptional regulator [Chelatococcus sp. GCM10030263]|uniref:LysR family transcriptional regulator n=1 Tax=Chelatococcus sp. GCM10030263 TaxID=3273387 RepID=UPI0036224C1F
MNRVTIAQLEAFYWVAELGSVHKAAAQLNVTQPTVSLRLRQLEAELASPVLERHGRGVRVTRAGHSFFSKAKLVLDAYAQMRSASPQSPISGVLRIGLAEGFAVACLPHLVPALAHEYPLLRPEWTVTTSSALEQDLVDGNLDLAVLVDAVGHRNLRLMPVGLQPNVWAASPTLAIKAGAKPRELSRFTVITTPPPTSMYRNTVAWFAGAGRKPGPLCICTSVNAAAQLVGAGIGIGVFPARMIEAYQAAGTITAIATEPPLAIGRVYLADRITADGERTEAVMRILEQVTRDIGYFGDQG